MPKWVGFDMDECIGSVMPLYSFVVSLPRLSGKKKEVLACVMQSLYLSESEKATWLFRPAMYTALELVYRAYKDGAIAGAFVFTNNGSENLVRFVAKYCNYWMARHARDFGKPKIFQMAVSRVSPLRSPGSLEKSYAEVQRALGGAGLSALSGPDDLLFFDDMPHRLQSEIAHYVQVRPYMNTCPLDRVVEALKDCAKLVTPEIWARVLEEAKADDRGDRRDGAVSTPPTVRDTLEDKAVFQGAFGSFLRRRSGGTRRRRRRRHRPGTRRVDYHK